MAFESFKKALHDAVLEEELDGKVVQKPAAPVYAPVPAATNTLAVPVLPSVDAEVYDMLLGHTDFSATALHKTIHKYLGPMKAAPLDENTKWKIAFAQAVEIDHITPDMVRKSFADLKQAVVWERDKLSATIVGRNKNIQTMRLNADSLVDQIAAKQKEVEELNQQRTTLLAKVETEKQEVNALTDRFEAAASRRVQELDKQLADLETVMK